MDLIAEIINHTFTWLDLLGWASFITVVVGKWLVIQKKWEGFAAQMLGDLGWIGFGFAIAYPSVIASEIVFFLMAAYGLYVWRSRYKDKINER